MPASTSRSAARLAATVVLVVLVGGCAGKTAKSTAASKPSATSTTVAPTTTIPPLSAEETAWLARLTKMRNTLEKKRDTVAQAGTTGITRALFALMGKVVGSCSRELARLGPPPSDRLQPVYALAKKACQQLSKAARCNATAARLSLPGGGVIAGSPQEQPMKEAVRCSGVAEEKGMSLLREAEAKGVEIKVNIDLGNLGG